jgi:hypothetical protein
LLRHAKKSKPAPVAAMQTLQGGRKKQRKASGNLESLRTN